MNDTPERLQALEPLWGTWRVDKFIGEGSYGRVYRIVRNERGLQYVSALKWISLPMNSGDIMHMRNERLSEAEIRDYYDDLLNSINDEIILMNSVKGNSNVVNYEDHMIRERQGEIGWDILIRMELLTPLDAYVRNDKFSMRDVAQLGIDICRALEICDRHKIIHRDIKPGNIFISDDGNYKLGDFGVARTMEHTMDNMSRRGTPVYMSPEVYFNKLTDRRADIYSLGLVMYRLLNNNRQPFLSVYGLPTHAERENAFQRRMRGEMLPSPLNGTRELKRAVLKACAFRADERYASAAALESELQHLIMDGSLDTEPLFGKTAPEKRNNLNSERSSLNVVVKTPSVMDRPAPVKVEPAKAEIFKRDLESTVIIPAPEAAQMRAPRYGASAPVLKEKQKAVINVAETAYPVEEKQDGETIGLFDEAVKHNAQLPPDRKKPEQPKAVRNEATPEQHWRNDNAGKPDMTKKANSIKKAGAAIAGVAAVVVLVIFMVVNGTFTGAESPTTVPTEVATNAPTTVPTEAATESPTTAPTTVPTEVATAAPTRVPTLAVHDITLGGKTFSSDVTELNLSNSGITDISALADCSNLTYLACDGNNISDISALRNLINLQILYCYNNSISDMSPLSNLINLEILDCADNNISDLNALDRLINLTELSCGSNNISNLSVLRNLIKLTYLNCVDNNITEQQIKNLSKALPDCVIESDYDVYENGENISAVQTEASNIMTPLPPTNAPTKTPAAEPASAVHDITLGEQTFSSDVTELNLLGHDITDISELANCSNLKSLNLEQCGSIADISALSGLHDLEYLNLSCDSIEDISALANLSKLKHLDLSANSVKDISPLANLHELTYLNVGFNPIEDMDELESILENLPNLTYVGLAQLSFSNIDPIVNMPYLTGMDISYNPIPDISFLRNWPDLDTLYLMGCCAEDISVLKELTNLEVLWMWGSELSDISFLENLTNLRELELGTNSISDISVLGKLTKLTSLGLDDNCISDISALKNLKKVDYLNLVGNPDITEEQLRELAKALPNSDIWCEYENIYE